MNKNKNWEIFPFLKSDIDSGKYRGKTKENGKFAFEKEEAFFTYFAKMTQKIFSPFPFFSLIKITKPILCFRIFTFIFEGKNENFQFAKSIKKIYPNCTIKRKMITIFRILCKSPFFIVWQWYGFAYGMGMDCGNTKLHDIPKLRPNTLSLESLLRAASAKFSRWLDSVAGNEPKIFRGAPADISLNPRTTSISKTPA